MTGYVVAFVGENANGILEWWTAAILKEIERAGYETRLVNALQPGWAEGLVASLTRRPPTFAFGLQGIGNNFAVNGQNVWATLDVPFFSYMGDAPYHRPRLHWQPNPRMYLLYSCQDFYDVYCDYLRGPATAVLHPYGFPENPHALERRWADREIEIAYVKTGVDPAVFSAKWEQFPRPLRAIAHDAAELALQGSNETIADICAARFAAESFTWGDRREIFCYVASTVDYYVRASRAAKMARFLMTLPGAHIYGPGWDFLDCSNSRATFHGNIPAGELPALYGNSKILASVTASVRHGLHERVMAGLLARAFVLSDQTPYARNELVEYPAFRCADVDGADFEEQAMLALRLPSDVDDALEQSYRNALEKLTLGAFVRPLLDLVALDGFEAGAAAFRVA
jgi:hypothetical protein